MEIDLNVARALASPTRIKILKELMDGENTSTSLSKDLGKSKSTIVNHIETLIDADLVEKEEAEGRRRVVYRPTRRARSIAKGGRRKVKFSLVSSIVSGLAGLGFLFYSFPSQESGSVGTLTAEATAGTTSQTSYGLLALGATFIVISLILMGYMYVINSLSS